MVRPTAARRPAQPWRTAAERAALGKAARGSVPRSRPASFEPPADRPDPVRLLQQQAATRIPELVAIRYRRMLASPLAFFRGAALPMAADLAATPSTGLIVQSCGDAHLSNFGVFASPESMNGTPLLLIPQQIAIHVSEIQGCAQPAAAASAKPLPP